MKALQFDLWVASHASQFDLQKKHPQGSAYNPMAFNDRTGYDKVLGELESKYLRKLKSDKK
jgi:metallo-beta-lactamase class B